MDDPVALTALLGLARWLAAGADHTAAAGRNVCSYLWVLNLLTFCAADLGKVGDGGGDVAGEHTGLARGDLREVLSGRD